MIGPRRCRASARRARLLLALASAAGAALGVGCSSGERFRPEHLGASEAVIYVYRPRAMIGPGPIGVVIDQREVARLGPNEYVAAVVEPGEHFVRVQRRASATRLVGIGAGQSAYLEAGADMVGGRVSLGSPGEAVARDRIASARRATPAPEPDSPAQRP
ncbi:MAG TPA: hypothetical protein VFF69_07150 [Phycisphaerales bacterium]|nr:hypothetical protein [Phycisphaerales bacterium]